MERKRLTGLRPQAYEHPLDKQALDALQRTPGLEILVRKINEWGFENLLRVQLTGSHLRVTADTLPELYAIFSNARELLDIPKQVELYVANGDINAFTAGVEHPVIVITNGAVERFTDDELLFVIGHEFGHVKSGHVLYYQMAQFFPIIADLIADMTFGIAGLASTAVQMALINWQRKSEFTADRAGLLACQNVDAAISAMMKIAGLPKKYFASVNTQDFIEQAKAFDALDTNLLTRLSKLLVGAAQTHPWTVLRAQQFLQWLDGGDYQYLLDNPTHLPLSLPPGIKSFCAHCGLGLKGAEAFCPGCGERVAVGVLNVDRTLSS